MVRTVHLAHKRMYRRVYTLSVQCDLIGKICGTLVEKAWKNHGFTMKKAWK